MWAMVDSDRLIVPMDCVRAAEDVATVFVAALDTRTSCWCWCKLATRSVAGFVRAQWSLDDSRKSVNYRDCRRTMIEGVAKV